VCVCVCVRARVRAYVHARLCPFHFYLLKLTFYPPIFILLHMALALPDLAGSLMQGAPPHPGLWAWASHCHASPPFASS